MENEIHKTESILRTKSFAFAVRIVKLCEYLTKEKQGKVLIRQILRSGTAIGSSIYEGEFGQSRADFISKMSIALKEANETHYWLDLLHVCNIITSKMYNSLNNDITELIAMLVATIKTAKKRLKE